MSGGEGGVSRLKSSGSDHLIYRSQMCHSRSFRSGAYRRGPDLDPELCVKTAAAIFNTHKANFCLDFLVTEKKQYF